MICYAFSLSHEARDILRHCTQKEQFSIGELKCTLGNLGDRPVLITLIGMGQTRAEENTRKIFQYFRPKAVVLAGYGGALVPQLKVGQIVVSNNFTSTEVVPFLRLLPGFDFGVFCTADEVAGTPEKRDWHARNTQGQVIDMETAAVAAVVHSREIPFVALRVISDDYKHLLPLGALAAGFDAARGRPTPLRLLAYLAAHPGEFSSFKRFVSGLGKARRNLTTFMSQLNAELPRSW